MLKQRIITALVLLAMLLPALFYPAPQAFSAVAILLIAAAAWEWASLNQMTDIGALAIGFLCALMCVGSWYFGFIQAPLRTLWIVTGGAWVLVGGWLLQRGSSSWLKVPGSLRVVGGVLALWVAWLAVAQARTIGINFLLSVLVLVWAADVFAYFGGRSFGGRVFSKRLAPTISPGKTWEGVCGGVVGVIACAFTWQRLDAAVAPEYWSLFSRLGANGPFFLVLAALFLTAMSVVGDLVESLFKRSAGVKDSSGLLPGHGGVLDRVDALLPILPLAMMFATL